MNKWLKLGITKATLDVALWVLSLNFLPGFALRGIA